jgi:hypothetical protein
MSSPSKVIPWECGICTYTNKDAPRRNCMMCQTRHPVGYVIVAGATAAATARMARVDPHKQARIATLATAVPVVAGEAPNAASGAIAGEVPTAANGPPAVVESTVIPPVQAPQSECNRASTIAWQHGGGSSSSLRQLAAVRWRQLGGSLAAVWHQWRWWQRRL